MIVGAVFGAATLLGLFIFAYLAATNPDFVCNSFVLLAAIFALGCALSAGFIGGAAAATGQLRSRAANNVLQYSVGGGVAILVIVFIIFQFLKPPHCASPVSMLDFDMLPINSHPTVSKFWYRVDPAYSQLRSSNSDWRRSSTIDETDNNNKVLASCSIIVHIANDFAPIIEKYKGFKLYTRDLLENEDEFHLDFKPAVPENGLKARSPECFFNEGHPVEQFIAISPRRGKTNVWHTGSSAGARRNRGLRRCPNGGARGELFYDASDREAALIQPALADNSVRPFAELKARLQSTNDVVRVAARRLLRSKL